MVSDSCLLAMRLRPRSTAWESGGVQGAPCAPRRANPRTALAGATTYGAVTHSRLHPLPTRSKDPRPAA